MPLNLEYANAEKGLIMQRIARCRTWSSKVVYSFGTLPLVTIILQVTGVCLSLPGSLIGSILVALGSLLAHLAIPVCTLVTIYIRETKRLCKTDCNMYPVVTVSICAAVASTALLKGYQLRLFLQVS